ncbi:glycosyltransferase family 2 protein [Mycolicibacterium fortuitum]|uniref:glycosyltransferase family 2 protein n=1 Tax=Mycolicibacterium fortuitum TaxID=1766 RepID=UPI00261B8E76|nr:glycosyltransferase family 2 protein [Mycolicibacterium fortuitum]
MTALIVLTVTMQVLFLLTVAVTLWFYRLPVNWVSPARCDPDTYPGGPPPIVLFYPVLHEPEATMRTTFLGLENADYPTHLKRVVAIPNSDDKQTIQSLRRLQRQFGWLEVAPVPPTTDRSWDVVFDAWEANPKAYWWHTGRRAGQRDLPPKKTRQLVWAMYQLVQSCPDRRTLLSYIDADTVIPPDYWYAGATGADEFDVTQTVNITGNSLESWSTSFHAMDHIGWDASIYPHMSADGKHPFYVLGKGLFFRLTDLVEIGGFHPWLTIEDPEVGMRLWTNGRRLGIIASALIEEVPATWRRGFTQRKRWIAGFFQSLTGALVGMGMPWKARLRARLNLVPVLSLMLNPLALLTATWAVVEVAVLGQHLPMWVNVLSAASLLVGIPLMMYRWNLAWAKTAQVLPRKRDRLMFTLRVNPLFSFVYGIWWIAPIMRGLSMYVLDQGLRWERTVKTDANHDLIRDHLRISTLDTEPDSLLETERKAS